jgi:hypothetical protein
MTSHIPYSVSLYTVSQPVRLYRFILHIVKSGYGYATIEKIQLGAKEARGQNNLRRCASVVLASFYSCFVDRRLGNQACNSKKPAPAQLELA